MTRFGARIGWAVMLLGVVGCGSGVKIGGGKSGAAAALSATTGPMKSAGAMIDLAGQYAAPGEATVSCEYGGTATVKDFQMLTNAGGQAGGAATSFSLRFDNCGATTWDNPETTAVEAEKVILHGAMTVTRTLAFDFTQPGASGNATLKLKGKVDYRGAFDDFVDADFTQTVDWSKLGTRGGLLTITANGHIGTSTSHYTYSDDQISFQAGVLVADAKK